MIRALLLALKIHAVWPGYPADRVIAVARAAVAAETSAIPAEVLVAIAQHESDFEPTAVSWRERERARVDILWTDQPLPTSVVCGYLQAAGGAGACRTAIAADGAMAMGAAELGVWVRSRLSAGSLRVALAGYAGGVAGARAARAGTDALAVRFADLFIARARRLGWQPTRRPTT